MSVKRLFLFASHGEAEVAIHRFKAISQGPIWKMGNDLLVVSGWGLESAFQACMRWGREADMIINLGIAGSLKESHALFASYSISSVGREGAPSLSLEQKGVHLFTSKQPLHDEELRNHLSKNWDLVDMEGYGVVLAAANLGLNCKLVKIVSDFAKKETKSLIYKNLSKHSEALAEVIHTEVQGEKLKTGD